MSSARENMKGLPGWPRLLSLGQVSAYLGISGDLFLQGSPEGTWPAPIQIGAHHRLWDRLALDAAVDRLSGVRDESRAKDYAARQWDEALERSAVEARKTPAQRAQEQQEQARELAERRERRRALSIQQRERTRRKKDATPE